jgi:hypothetical protein
MDRRQDGTAAADFAAGLVPMRGASGFPHQDARLKDEPDRREAADRPSPQWLPMSFLRTGTAIGAAMRDTGSARRRPRTTDPAPSRPAGAYRGGRAFNALTEILTR